MTTIQEYLNGKYPTLQDKKTAKKIDIREINEERKDQGITEKLEGENLDLSEYPNLKKIWIERGWLKTCLIDLNISNCKELTELDCHSNKLTSLDLTNCYQLKNLNCGCNLLTSLDLVKNHQLESLSISDNNFPKPKPINTFTKLYLCLFCLLVLFYFGLDFLFLLKLYVK